MFGYVRPASDRLSEPQQKCFEAAYCGLCHALGQRYGLAGRMILNYDLVFLAMLLSEGTGKQCQKRCIRHPMNGRPCACGDGAFDLAADISVILTWWQLQDGVADHTPIKGVPYRTASLLLRQAYERAQLCRPDFDEATKRHLQALAQLEREQCPSIDAVADTFAQLLAEAARETEDGVRRRVLEQLLYHLGRWIYLVDAADDLADDVRKGNYNPLPLRYHLPDGVLDEAARQELAHTLDSSIRAMGAAFELWDFGEYGPVIESTVYQGLYAVGTSVLEGTFRRKKRAIQKERGTP